MKNKILKLSGDRQSGRTTFLVNSIFVHLLDPSLSNDISLVVSAPTTGSRLLLAENIISKLEKANENFSSSRDVGEIKIIVGKKVCRIVPPEPRFFIGHKINYIFLDNADYLDEAFKDFIDLIMRPNVVVLQTVEQESVYLSDIKVIDQ